MLTLKPTWLREAIGFPLRPLTKDDASISIFDRREIARTINNLGNPVKQIERHWSDTPRQTVIAGHTPVQNGKMYPIEA